MIENKKFLSWSYYIGGYYDLLIGIPMLFFYKQLAKLFKIDMPESPIFIQLTAIFLIVVGYFLVFSASKAENYIFIGFGSALARLCYFVVVMVQLIVDDVELIFVIFSIVDLITAIMLLTIIFTTQGLKIRLIKS